MRILPKPVRDTVKRTRPIYDLSRRARVALGSGLGARYVPELGGKAHFNDFALASTAHDAVMAYRRSATEFVDILTRALHGAGHDWPEVWKCLDVGCGYGRVVRELKDKLPDCAISVCDLSEERARFTASEFGVRRLPIVEMMGPERNGTFDLVYALSLYSHLDRPMIEMNLAKLAALTRPGGVVVFTVHGERSAQTADRYGQYWLDQARILADLAESGFSYQRYPYAYDEDGVSWITAGEVERLAGEVAPDLAFVAHYPAAVGGHEDVFVYRKA